jgi:hypothetical protein
VVASNFSTSKLYQKKEKKRKKGWRNTREKAFPNIMYMQYGKVLTLLQME